MQFQVPQFIETEDKIIGPLTIRQFIYVAIAGAISFVLYLSVQTWLWALLSVFLGGIAAAMAFVNVHGRSLVNIIVSAFNFYWSPQTYVWQPEHPEAKKEEVTVREAPTLEDIISGMALRRVWQNLQTGTKVSGKGFFEKIQGTQKKYQIFQKVSGERRAARRIDYR